MVTPDDFSIGWICAVSVELAAARSMLDEQYETPPVPRHDPNVYTVGRMAQYRVVIACPPNGTYGTSSAARVANEMVRTFRNIRFALLVGIAGGVPNSDHEIRLGDVVVGRSGGGHPGVIQYDMGKASHGSGFVRIGALSPPPAMLLTASSKLEAAHMREEPRFVEYIAAATALYPEMEDVWSPPSDLKTPQIHYGLIASGNSVMKSGKARDKLSQEEGILCFEMEAAGLMGDFPCLVIRGICDYADSHKNDIWQSYASATAAAYAKELLGYVDSTEVGYTVPAIDYLDLDYNGNEDEDLSSISTDNATTTYDLSSTSSTTMVDGSDGELINKAAERIAEVMVSDRQLKAACTACVSSMTAPMFQRRIIPILSRYGMSMEKSVRTPLGQSLASLIRHRRRLISFIIRKSIFGSQSNVDDAGWWFGKMSEEETERLKHLVESRFKKAQSGGARQPRRDDTEVDVEEGVDEGDPEETIVGIAPSMVDIDLGNIAPVLFSGDPYWEFYRQLKSLAFPAPIQELTRVLQRHISDDGSSYVVNCLIESEVLEFMESEKITVTDLDSIFTLTGTFDRAAAYRLGDYMRQRWQSGDAILDAFKKLVAPHLSESKDATNAPGVTATLALDHEINIQTVLGEEGEHMLLQVKGNFGQIRETLEQFSWLATTLRRGSGGGLTVSEIRFRFANLAEGLFELSLLKQSDDRKPDSNEVGQCWTSLFKESNLAYGFSLCDDDRPVEMVGLEVPFPLMAAFAGVKYPVHFAGRTALAGSSTLLTPIVASGDCIQWHYSHGEYRFDSCSQHVKVLDSKLHTMTWPELTTARTFLGFATRAEILLGTKYLPVAGISESNAPWARGRISLATEGPLTIEWITKGIFKVSMGSMWKFSRTAERAQLEEQQRSLIDRIRDSQHTPALLYDYEAARAFLVPELSVILHMVSAYLHDCSSLPQDRIPCADPCPNSKEAAFRLVEQEQDLDIPLKLGKSRKYCDIINEFVEIWEQRKLQTSARKADLSLHPREGIRGWDFVDMQNKKREFFEREIPTSVFSRQSEPLWWEVFTEQPCMIVFGGNIGCPIRKIAHDMNQPYCNAWADIPTGKHMLLAHVSSFTQLTKICCSQSQQKIKHRPHHMITDKLAWARPKGSTLFEPCRQGHSCSPVQTMTKIRRWHQWDKSYERIPGDMENNQDGAALFADDPNDFAPRPCSFEPPRPPNPGQPNPLPVSTPPVNISIICYIWAGCFGVAYILSIL